MLKSNADFYEHLLCGSFKNEVKPMFIFITKVNNQSGKVFRIYLTFL